MEPTPQKIKKAKKLANLVDKGGVAIVEHLLELEEKFDETVQEIEKRVPNLTKILDDIRGKDGHSPILGQDYFTKEDKMSIVDAVFAKVKVPIPENGTTPIPGKDYPTKKEIESYINKLFVQIRFPKDGTIGERGETGLSGKDGSPDTPVQVRDKLEKLKEDERLDITAIKGVELREQNLQDYLINRAIGIVDQRTSFLINKVSNLSDRVNRTSGGTPGGSNTQIQFNDSGTFGGDADFTWNKTTNVLTVVGDVTAGNFNINGGGLNVSENFINWGAPTSARSYWDDSGFYSGESSPTLMIDTGDPAASNLSSIMFAPQKKIYFGHATGTYAASFGVTAQSAYDATATGGRLGIGTVTPAGILDISDGSGSFLLIDRVNNIYYLGDKDGTSTGVVLKVDAANNYSYIQNGFFGINTSTPTHKIEIGDTGGDFQSNSALKVGALEFQPYAVNNCWFGDNVYYTGAEFTRRVDGAAGLFYFQGTEGQFRFYASGSGSLGSGAGSVVQLKINTNGTVGLGGASSNVSGSFTGNSLIVSSTTATLAEAINVIVGTTTGTKIGTATTQKLSFFNATPIIQPANSLSVNTVLTTLGLQGSGGAYVASDLTAQSAAITATTLYAVPSTGVGMYRVSWVATITTAASTSSVLGGTNSFQLKYTDANDSVVKTTAAPVVTSAANTTATQISGVEIAYCKASTNLQYLFDYTSVGVTAMQYNLHIKVEAL